VIFNYQKQMGENIMKTTTCLMTILFAGIMATGSGVVAQTQGSNQMMHDSTQEQKTDTKQGMMGSQGMGSGMMGGQGMGPGMMESCQEMMGSGKMGSGKMGSGMMGGDGMGSMHHGMMGMMDGMDGMDGYGAMQKMMGFKSSEEFEKFLEDTKEQRRKLHDMRFEYVEKKRQPETTVGELKKMKQEMADLMKQIHEKVAK
jgi:hypothetical protein